MARRHPIMSKWYVDYLASGAWDKRRKKIFAKRGALCEDCKRCRTGLTLHHITYARVRHERAEDFRILCPWCHRRAHRTHDIPYLFMIYRELTPENVAIFKAARREENFPYPRMRAKKEGRRWMKIPPATAGEEDE